jgi:NAD(P)H dehydrogenase (quinone)
MPTDAPILVTGDARRLGGAGREIVEILRSRDLLGHVFDHVRTMAKLHADNHHDRPTHNVEAVMGRPATSIRTYVARHREIFGSSKSALVFP